jgi:hypothetical protein
MNDICKNTDKEIWRERPADFYADSIHVTTQGGIGKENKLDKMKVFDKIYEYIKNKS